MSVALPVLYSFRRCPYAIRARLALAASGQAYALCEVVLRDKPAALLRASPKGTVPVLVLPDGRVLEQSLDIMLWALHRHDPQQWLGPDSAALGDMLALVAQCDGPFKQALDRCKYPQRYPDADPAQAWAAASAWLELLEARLCNTPNLCGTQTALADVAIFPFVRQFAAINPGWWSTQPWPHLQAWLQQWLGNALVIETLRKPDPAAHNPAF